MSPAVSKKAVLLVVALGSFLTPFMGSSVNVALPSIGVEFSIDAVLLSWVPTSYLLASAMFLVPFGRIADLYGRKRIFTYGLVVYAVSSLLCAISPSAMVLIAFRILQGFGGALIFATGVAILTSAFPIRERGKALGIAVAATYLGLSLGPPLGGLLTEYLGWRSIFLVNVPLGFIAVSLTSWKLRGEWAEAEGETFDTIGSIMFGATLVALMYGLSSLPAMTGLWLILIGGLGVLVFVAWEMTTRSPVLDVSLFRNNTVFAFSNLAALVNYSATFAIAFLLSLYLQYIKGFSPQDAGFILISQPLAQAVLSPFAGRLSDVIEPRLLASAGMTLTVIGLSLLAFLSRDTGVESIVGILILLEFSFGLFSSPNTNAVMSSVGKKSYGVAAATVATMRVTGMMLSMGVAMLVFALYIGRVQITPEYHDLFLASARTAFIVFAALCFAGVFASLARGKLR